MWPTKSDGIVFFIILRDLCESEPKKCLYWAPEKAAVSIELPPTLQHDNVTNILVHVRLFV
jgi:hypothetical protein